jgi:hypothetical protein
MENRELQRFMRQKHHSRALQMWAEFGRWADIYATASTRSTSEHLAGRYAMRREQLLEMRTHLDAIMTTLAYFG